MTAAYPLQWPEGFPRAKTRHPDHGGTASAFAELTAAREQALKEIAGS